ncbi:MAG: OmpA family protein, partial [Candidatus Adiutricales bacterium]
KTLEKRLSTRSVYRAAAVILLIIALLATAYAIYNRQVDPVSVSLRSFNNRLKEITVSIEQEGQLIEEFNRKQNQLITQFENLDEQVNSIGIKIANLVSEGQLENSFLTRADTLTELSALEKKMAALERKTSSLAGMDQEAARPVMVQGKKIEIYRISTELYFTSGGSEISEQGKARVKSLSEKIKSRPNVFIRVEGHTDDKLLRWTSVGRYVDNRGLSLARAAVVTRLLIETGLTPKRISTFGLGSSQPIVPNTSPENRSVNRRVEIIVTHNGD